MNQLSIQENDTIDRVQGHWDTINKISIFMCRKVKLIFMIYDDLPNAPLYPEFENHTDAATR